MSQKRGRPSSNCSPLRKRRRLDTTNTSESSQSRAQSSSNHTDSSQAQFVIQEPSKLKHEFKIHIAIDFGTDGTGLIIRCLL